MIRRTLSVLLVLSILLAACAPAAAPAVTPTPAPPQSTTAAATALAGGTPVSAPAGTPVYQDAAQPVAARVDDLMARMTPAEKIGQMTQVEKGSIKAGDIARLGIGSLLSGGGGSPQPNDAAAWARMVDGFQSEALQSRLAIPLIYGVDAVHGHNNLYGATIFPHNIGLGAARDADLVQRVGRATAEEMAATGIRWNFAPVVAVVQDIRWGRTYESYGENTELVTRLGTAYLQGLQNAPGTPGLANPLAVLATPKHFIGDGGTTWGSSTTDNYKLDQGDLRVDENTLRARFLPPYKAAVDAGAQSIMVSFSSWNGTKLHAQQHLITDVLKGELGFKGFVVSDWQAIDQISPDYNLAVETSINAGLDMIMVPYDYNRFISTLTGLVESGKVPQSRIDDAVRRILAVKFELGLFERPLSDPQYLPMPGSDAHRQLAREAVQKSLVLLKNDHAALPIDKSAALIYVAGQAADDMGVQCGGWTIEWQGRAGDIEPGTTLLKGIQQAVAPATKVEFNRFGKFDAGATADVAIVVLGEQPYAEGQGDREDLTLAQSDADLVSRVKAVSKKVVVVLLSGRPLVVTPYLQDWDALVAAWLPGTEGQGVADALFGSVPFTGKLPFTWPRASRQLPFDYANMATSGCGAPLFPYGYGLGDGSQPPDWIACP